MLSHDGAQGPAELSRRLVLAVARIALGDPARPEWKVDVVRSLATRLHVDAAFEEGIVDADLRREPDADLEPVTLYRSLMAAIAPAGRVQDDDSSLVRGLRRLLDIPEAIHLDALAAARRGADAPTYRGAAPASTPDEQASVNSRPTLAPSEAAMRFDGGAEKVAESGETGRDIATDPASRTASSPSPMLQPRRPSGPVSRPSLKLEALVPRPGIGRNAKVAVLLVGCVVVGAVGLKIYGPDRAPLVPPSNIAGAPAGLASAERSSAQRTVPPPDAMPATSAIRDAFKSVVATHAQVSGAQSQANAKVEEASRNVKGEIPSLIFDRFRALQGLDHELHRRLAVVDAIFAGNVDRVARRAACTDGVGALVDLESFLALCVSKVEADQRRVFSAAGESALEKVPHEARRSLDELLKDYDGSVPIEEFARRRGVDLSAAKRAVDDVALTIKTIIHLREAYKSQTAVWLGTVDTIRSRLRDLRDRAKTAHDAQARAMPQTAHLPFHPVPFGSNAPPPRASVPPPTPAASPSPRTSGSETELAQLSIRLERALRRNGAARRDLYNWAAKEYHRLAQPLRPEERTSRAARERIQGIIGKRIQAAPEVVQALFREGSLRGWSTPGSGKAAVAIPAASATPAVPPRVTPSPGAVDEARSALVALGESLSRGSIPMMTLKVLNQSHGVCTKVRAAIQHIEVTASGNAAKERAQFMQLTDGFTKLESVLGGPNGTNEAAIRSVLREIASAAGRLLGTLTYRRE